MSQANKVKDCISKERYPPNNGPYKLNIDIVKRDILKLTKNKARHGPKNCRKRSHDEISSLVPGLIIIPNLITANEEKILFKELSAGSWEETPIEENIGKQPSRRRVRHFGYKFDYSTRRAAPENLNNWPKFLEPYVIKAQNEIRRAVNDRNWTCDQGTVNEYLPGEGIAKHVDTHSAFKDGIGSLSLGSDTIITFACPLDYLSHDIYIPRRSLFIMTKESRYKFTHQMIQRKTDKIDNVQVPRGTRISVTFRHTLPLGQVCNCEFKHLCDSANGRDMQS